MKFAVVLAAVLLSACWFKTDIPTEFPTPEPLPVATPLAKLDLKRDAELEKQFADIAKDAKGKVGAAAVVLETGESALLNADQHYPMQSVYKLPISMAMMDQIRLDRHALDEQIGVTKDDMVRQGQASPLRDKNPDGGVFTMGELIRLALVESDGSASDVLLRVLGGPNVVQQYLSQIGIEDMTVVNTEKELGQNWDTQYKNWTTPLAAVGLLTWLQTASASDDDQQILLRIIGSTVTGPNRLIGLLPKGVGTAAHKTGTSGTRDGITAATNDIGLIGPPNGTHIAIAVFVSDSPADEKTREAVIAKIAKAAWDKWSQGSKRK